MDIFQQKSNQFRIIYFQYEDQLTCEIALKYNKLVIQTNHFTIFNE